MEFKQKHAFRMFVLIFATCCASPPLRAQKSGDPPKILQSSTENISCDFPYLEEGHLYQDVYFMSDAEAILDINIKCFKTDQEDSIKIYSVEAKKINISRGVNKVRLPFKDKNIKSHIDEGWLNALKSIDRIPAGTYKYKIQIGGDKPAEKTILFESDSLLDQNNKLSQGISKILGNNAIKISRGLTNKEVALNRYYKKKGIICQRSKNSEKELLNLFYGKWFLGRIELTSEMPAHALTGSLGALKGNTNSITQSGIESYTSLMSQFRELKKEGRENAELTGEFSLAGNFANGQEPNSRQDNNYYEGRADLEFPIFDIPIQLSGYYTTQDRHRKAKSSYVHFRYDAEKAKEQLMKLISGFDKKYEEAVTKGASYDMIYGQFISGLQKEKENTIAGFKKDYGLDASGLSQMNEQKLEALLKEKAKEQEDKLLDSAEHMAGNSGAANDALKQKEKAMAAKRKAEAAQAAAMEKYRKLQELEKKIQKYQALLEQYKNTNYYDSLLAYDKVKDLKNLEKMSYKDMAKKASGLLPEGKAKKMVTGLVNFDAGMFPKYVSDYTMSGQMLKGLDMSYDVGIGTLGGSYGKMEYIGRDGSVEAYKSYSGRMQFKPVYNQQFGFVYYGYSPSKSLLNDNNFFKSESVSLPSFRNPVHILSTTYEGKLSEYVSLRGEYAFSSKPKQSEEARKETHFMDRSAYNLKLEGTIPETNISVEAGYEHAGSAFENNTLPILLAGTDRILAKAKGDFFKGFITLGAEYNYLIQRSFYSKGNNSKWGFDIATHSKRYPSFALSYKPFSTFRSFNDTLSIAQKPISGEVWTGKANYQIKRMDRAIRFTFVYSRNSSTNDTIRYKSEVTQLGTVYTKKTLMVMGTIGHSNINTDYVQTTYPIYNNSWFGNLSWSDVVKEKILLSAGTDIAKAGPGISKYGCFLSGGYSFKTLPLTLRANVRYSNYRMTEVPAWQQLYSGGLELTWRIKEKLFND